MEINQIAAASGEIQQLLELQKRQQRRQNTLIFACALMLAAMLALAAVLGVVLLPRVTGTLDSLQQAAESISNADIETLVQNFSTVAETATTSLASVDTVIGNAGAAITDATAAVENLESIDVATLNQAITNLNDAVEPMASFFNRFKQ